LKSWRVSTDDSGPGMWNWECGLRPVGNAEMEFAECLIHIIIHIPHSLRGVGPYGPEADFRIPVTRTRKLIGFLNTGSYLLHFDI